MDECRTLDDLLRRSTLKQQDRNSEFDKVLFGRWVKRAVDNWTKIKCVCECADADAYVRNTSDKMTVDWDVGLQIRFHSAIRAADPTWPLDPKPLGPGDFPPPPTKTRRLRSHGTRRPGARRTIGNRETCAVRPRTRSRSPRYSFLSSSRQLIALAVRQC
jgi:hypothetical protein